MDGSLEADGKTPASFDYNVAVTTEVVAYAHARGVTVEGELGTLGGIEDGHGSGEVHLTDPDEAVEFVASTGIDALAVAIGTSHGAYKFAQAPDGDVLKMDLIEEIHRRLPDTHLVMHGSSSVPPELVEQINRYGGALKPAWGVPVEEIQLGIRHGVRKINVDTDSRLAVTGAIRKVFAESPEKFDPRDYLKPARAAMQELIAHPDARLRTGGPRRRLRAALAGGDARGLRRGSCGGVDGRKPPESEACSTSSRARPGSKGLTSTSEGRRRRRSPTQFGTPLVVYCEQTLRDASQVASRGCRHGRPRRVRDEGLRQRRRAPPPP